MKLKALIEKLKALEEQGNGEKDVVFIKPDRRGFTITDITSVIKDGPIVLQ